MRSFSTTVALGAAFAILAVGSPCFAQVSVAPLAAKIKAVDVEGKGHAEATKAVVELQKAAPSQLPEILATMDGASPLAVNWLRAAVEAVAAKAGDKLPAKEIEAFLADVKHHPRARRLAFELIAAVDAKAESRIIPGLLDDPSLELRRDAVAMAAAAAQALVDQGKKEEGAKAFVAAFAKARDVDQIGDLATKAKAAGGDAVAKKVDIARHMGFLTDWHVVGPFENAGDKGWDVAYEPEAAVDLAAKYKGNKGEVDWKAHTTAEEYGIVDLNAFLDKHKGSIAYATAEFDVPNDRAGEIRYGCINATKVWLNGQPVASNHVYHAGMDVDQYVAKVKLKKGQNRILIKVAQNEQTETWAQRWQFQCRVCDEIGTPVWTRPGADTASLSNNETTRIAKSE